MSCPCEAAEVVNDLPCGSPAILILVAKSKTPSQAACSMTRLKAEVRVCSGASPRSQLIN
jgi:hypothetical protein